VSWVFKKQTEFSEATRAAVLASGSRFEEVDNELPIPQRVMGKVSELWNQIRQANAS